MRELKKEDFERGKWGPAVEEPPGKIKISIRLDEDILTWFKTRAKENMRNYQTDINQVLRDYINGAVAEQSQADARLRKIVREELERFSEKKLKAVGGQ
jgi:hypothetical protein